MSDTVTVVDVEVPLFDVEEQLADHLVIDASAREIYRAGVTTEYLLVSRAKNGEWKGQEKHGAQLLEYVTKYMAENKGVPPTATQIVTEFPFQPQTPVVSVEFLIEKMKDRYLLGRLDEIITIGTRGIGTLGVTGKLEERKAAVRHMRNDLDAVLRDVTTGEAHGLNVLDWHQHYLDFKDRMANQGEGVTFGAPQIDKRVGKLTGLTFLIGRPKQGKSWFLLWSAIGAIREGHRPIFFSLEMPDWEMMDRFQSLATDVSYARRSRDEWDQQDEAKFGMGMSELENEGLLNMPIIHLPPGQRSVGNLLEKAKEFDADIMYIDQYSFLSDEILMDKNLPMHEAHSRLCQDLKNASLEMPVYIAAQFGRDATKLERPEDMANLEHIGLSDQIGQKADTIMGLWQTQDMKNSSPPFIQFRVIESRSRGIGAWHLFTDYENACHISYKEAMQL